MLVTIGAKGLRESTQKDRIQVWHRYYSLLSNHLWVQWTVKEEWWCDANSKENVTVHIFS